MESGKQRDSAEKPWEYGSGGRGGWGGGTQGFVHAKSPGLLSISIKCSCCYVCVMASMSLLAAVVVIQLCQVWGGSWEEDRKCFSGPGRGHWEASAALWGPLSITCVISGVSAQEVKNRLFQNEKINTENDLLLLKIWMDRVLYFHILKQCAFFSPWRICRLMEQDFLPAG